MANIDVKEVKTAKELWDLLSPENLLFKEPCDLLYRGQSDATWSLEPSIFRASNNPIRIFREGDTSAENQIFAEYRQLENFLEHCDRIGIAIPGDSKHFRNENLNRNNTEAFDRYLKDGKLWPNPQLYDLLAIAQHHGLTTRLLDWSKRSYVAAYFAASGAMRKLESNHRPTHLAVWVLNIEMAGLFEELEIVNVPSGFNKNIAAQSGCFTLLRQKAKRGKPFEGTHLLDIYLEQQPETPLIKLTLPLSEAAALLDLCKKYHITGSTLFPDLYGAVKACEDDLLCWIQERK